MWGLCICIYDAEMMHRSDEALLLEPSSEKGSACDVLTSHEFHIPKQDLMINRASPSRCLIHSGWLRQLTSRC
jgi:hypothetical protein